MSELFLKVHIKTLETKLIPLAKLLFSYLNSYTIANKKIVVGNEHLAEYFGVEVRHIRDNLLTLEILGYIKQNYYPQVRKNFKSRESIDVLKIVKDEPYLSIPLNLLKDASLKFPQKIIISYFLQKNKFKDKLTSSIIPILAKFLDCSIVTIQRLIRNLKDNLYTDLSYKQTRKNNTLELKRQPVPPKTSSSASTPPPKTSSSATYKPFLLCLDKPLEFDPSDDMEAMIDNYLTNGSFENQGAGIRTNQTDLISNITSKFNNKESLIAAMKDDKMYHSDIVIEPLRQYGFDDKDKRRLENFKKNNGSKISRIIMNLNIRNYADRIKRNRETFKKDSQGNIDYKSKFYFILKTDGIIGEVDKYNENRK